MVSESGIMSPRSNLSRFISHTKLPEAEQSAAADLLVNADAENKLRCRKLYLVLDLDETLVYSRRMAPGETATGHKILVRGSPFDMVLRPGLLQFLKVATRSFIVYLYTMGDEEYTQAVLAVIDPERKLFAGGILCWRPSESRHHKNLQRVVCDKRMALIVDDTVDVWQDDLANLCIIRRFIGDRLDDGLQRLSWQLQEVHRTYFADVAKFSLDDPEDHVPPDVREVLQRIRGSLLADTRIALTGVVPDQSENTLDRQPLCALLRLYGAQLTLSSTEATHLVARKKDGWTNSSKIRKALQRRQAETDFHAVWDHWLLDSIVTWDRQPELNYAIPSLDAAGAPTSEDAASAFVSEGLGGRLSEIINAVNGNNGREELVVPTRKRVRDVPADAPQSLASTARLSVASYLKQKSATVNAPASGHDEIESQSGEEGGP